VGAGQGHRDGQGIVADPKGVFIGQGLEPADKTVYSSLAVRIPVCPIVQKGPKPQIVKTPAEDPPGMAAYKSAGYGHKTAPKDGYGYDY
jgi:hypothetical protein